MNGFVNLVYSGSNSSIPYNGNVTNSGSFVSDSNAGLNFRTIFKNKSFAQFQFLLFDDFINKKIELKLSQAFIGYIHENKLYSSFGKIHLPIWNYSEYKYLSKLYPWIRPPEEVYTIFQGEDVLGAGLEYRKHYSRIFNKFHVVLGTMKTTNYRPISTYNGIESDTRTDYSGPVVSVNDTLKIKNLELRFSHTYLRFKADVVTKIYSGNNQSPKVVTETLYKIPKLKFDFSTTGLKYKYKRFVLHSEIVYGRIAIDHTNKKVQSTFGGYLTTGHRFRNVGLYLTLAHQVLRKYKVDSLVGSDAAQLRVRSLAGVLSYSLSSSLHVKFQLKKSELYDGFGKNISNFIGSQINGSKDIVTYGASINAMF